MTRFRRSLFLASFGLVWACTDTTAPGYSVHIDSRFATLGIGDSAQLTARVLTPIGAPVLGATVTWASSAPSVLEVSPSGLVHALIPGTATITAFAQGAHDTLAIQATVAFVQIAQGIGTTNIGESRDGDLCGVAPTGAIYCRGPYNYGQLGNGTTIPSSTFVPVSGGLLYRQVTEGLTMTCGVAQDSSGLCWGLGNDEPLGVGDTAGRLVPAPLSGGLHFGEITAGSHACGLTGNGSAYCWGFNWFGSTGDTALFTLAPRAVGGGLHFTTLSASFYNTCGVTSVGTAYCWGDNSAEQLGSVTDSFFHAPTAVAGGHVFVSLTARGMPCGVTAGGDAFCWGADSQDAPRGMPVPQPLSSPAKLVQLGAGVGDHACGVGVDSLVYCWTWDLKAAALPGSVKFRSVTGGYDGDCGIATDSTAYCWVYHCGLGWYDCGPVNPLPQPVPGVGKIVQLATGDGRQACGLAPTGSVTCWSQGGAGTDTTPAFVAPLPPVHAITMDVASEAVCGIGADSLAYCWTLIQQRTDSARPLAGGLHYSTLDASYQSTCGKVASGDVYCLNTNQDSLPQLVPGSSGLVTPQVTELGGGCGLDAGGAAYCWGWNNRGWLGIGYESQISAMPLAVSGGLTFQGIAVGGDHTCGIATGGAAYCWGSNISGALGTGDSVASAAPRAVIGGVKFQSLALGSELSCGVDLTGGAWCWGRGRTRPVTQMPGTKFRQLTAQGIGQACGLTVSLGVQCLAQPISPVARRQVRSRLRTFSGTSFPNRP